MSSIIPWKPFSELDRFFDNEDWFPILSRTDMSNRPAMDVYETDKEVIAEVNIPDFDPQKINVSVENDILKISGSMDKQKEEKEKGYWRKEIRKGSFERMVRLPSTIKEDAVEATYEKGLLKIVMPKTEPKPSSKVQIKIKEK